MLAGFAIIHLARTKVFPQNQHFLPPDTHTQGVKNEFFWKILRMYRMNDPVTQPQKNYYEGLSQLAFTCSKSTIETLEQGVNLFRVNN